MPNVPQLFWRIRLIDIELAESTDRPIFCLSIVVIDSLLVRLFVGDRQGYRQNCMHATEKLFILVNTVNIYFVHVKKNCASPKKV